MKATSRARILRMPPMILGLGRPPGFHTTAREPKRAHLRVPAFRNTTKIQREDPQRERERARMGGEDGKKKRNFGPPAFGPQPLFLGLGPHLSGPPPFGPPPFGQRPSGPPLFLGLAPTFFILSYFSFVLFSAFLLVSISCHFLNF